MTSSRVAAPLIVLLLTLPLVADEIRPVAAPGFGSMPSVSSGVSVAFGASGGFAVWRVGFGEIWGVPLGIDGRPIAPARLVIRDPLATQSPAVQVAGDGFTIWWQNGYPSFARVARVDRLGNVIETKTITERVSPSAQNSEVTLAFGIRENDLTAIFLDRNLQLLRSDSLASLGASYLARAAVMADGQFSVIVAGWSGLYFVRYSREGERIGAPLLIEASRGTTATAYRPLSAAVATDGESTLIVWTAGAYGELPEMKSVIVAKEGSVSPVRTVLENRWKSIRVEARWGSGAYTVAVSAGDVEANERTLDIYAARFSRDGAPVGEGFVPVIVRPGLEYTLVMATSAERQLLFFQSGDYGAEEIFVVALPQSGSVSRPDPTSVDARISDSAAWQSAAVAASDGSGWLAVWLERLATREEIRAVALDATGAPTSEVLTLASVFRWIGSPQVVFNGVDYVVAWNHGSTVFAERVRRDGTVVDAEPLIISTGAHGFAMTARDGVTLFALSTGAIDGKLFHASGVLTAAFPISSRPSQTDTTSISYKQPVVSAGRQTFLVAWTEETYANCGFPPCRSDYRAEAQLVARDGSPRSPILKFDESSPFRSAAAGGTHLLTFNSRGAVVIDEVRGSVSGRFQIAPADAQWMPLGAGEEYIVATRPTYSAPITIQRYSATGNPGAIEGTDAFTLPQAVNSAGRLLAIGSISTHGAPYYGAPAVMAQEVETGLPPTVRRRTVRP